MHDSPAYIQDSPVAIAALVFALISFLMGGASIGGLIASILSLESLKTNSILSLESLKTDIGGLKTAFGRLQTDFESL